MLDRLIRALGIPMDADTFVLAMGLVLARSLPLLFLNPFLGGRVVPGPVKMATAFSFVVFLVPLLSAQQGSIPGGVLYMFLMLKEIAVGMTLGFVTLLVFLGFSSAGRLIDTQRGTNQAEAMFYQLQERTSVLGTFYGQTAVVVFLAVGGHLVFLKAYFHSFEVLPVSSFPALTGGTMPVMEALIRMSSDVLVITLQLAAPALIALFLTDVGFGIINRAAPQVNVFVLSQPAKVAVGLGLVLLVLRVLLDQFEENGATMLTDLTRIMNALGS